jgi:signal transduction histidine kinase
MGRHDIRNQLTVVGGFAQLLQHKRVGALENHSIEILQNILVGVRKIIDVLDIAKYAA